MPNERPNIQDFYKDISDGSTREWFSNQPTSDSGPDYVKYFNDFLESRDYTAADWTITTVEAGGSSATEAIAGDEKNGALLITNDTNDNDSDSLQLDDESWALEAGKKFWFETKLKTGDADQIDNFYGLCVTDTTPLTAVDRVGFQVTDGSASIEFLCEKDSAETKEDTEIDGVDDTYITLGFYWDGSTKVEYYVNRIKKGDISTNVPDDENLAVTFHHQNGEAAGQTLTIDYIYCLKER